MSKMSNLRRTRFRGSQPHDAERLRWVLNGRMDNVILLFVFLGRRESVGKEGGPLETQVLNLVPPPTVTLEEMFLNGNVFVTLLSHQWSFSYLYFTHL